jgi:hypothetical protein
VIGCVVLAFPAAAAAVHAYGADRGATADLLAVIYSFGLYAAFSTPWWPLPSMRRETAFERLQSMCMLWFWITYTTHLTWELGWLLLREKIVTSPDAPWAYLWWAYIDGGDMRYASADPNLYTMEILSVANGTLGFAGLYLWYRSAGRNARAVLLLMATAVVHLYSTSLYYGAEIAAGLPNVDPSSFLDFWIKFVLANSPWLVMPWLVLYWGLRVLAGGEGGSTGRGGSIVRGIGSSPSSRGSEPGERSSPTAFRA